eukprot:TRINITY_DN33666_c0_g1_i1.p1 TRINITY_DN33666_c0_g1~~TRINITY_DN33666_c0_g1_i1.p1  ORF type:complete len:271 (+),score=61.36 TRINITY_DN33666_c0_g1_i1:110-922(+)
MCIRDRFTAMRLDIIPFRQMTSHARRVVCARELYEPHDADAPPALLLLSALLGGLVCALAWKQAPRASSDGKWRWLLPVLATVHTATTTTVAPVFLSLWLMGAGLVVLLDAPWNAWATVECTVARVAVERTSSDAPEDPVVADQDPKTDDKSEGWVTLRADDAAAEPGEQDCQEEDQETNQHKHEDTRQDQDQDKHQNQDKHQDQENQDAHQEIEEPNPTVSILRATQLQQLAEMGFEEHAADTALDLAGDSMKAAIRALIQQERSHRQS